MIRELFGYIANKVQYLKMSLPGAIDIDLKADKAVPNKIQKAVEDHEKKDSLNPDSSEKEVNISRPGEDTSDILVNKIRSSAPKDLKTSTEESQLESELHSRHKTEIENEQGRQLADQKPILSETKRPIEEDTKLSEQVDFSISEVTNVLNAKRETASEVKEITFDINGLPTPTTSSEAEQKKLFIDSLPQIKPRQRKPSSRKKTEHYQSLKKYLVHESFDKPPVPLQTYRWEDLRRAKERGGYPWTHLYKRPLGPEEEPEIVLLLRKSQELHFSSESPKSLKKVRIDDQVSVKEAERYIQDLYETEDDNNPATEEDEENHSVRSESISCVSDSVLTVDSKKRKSSQIEKIRSILKRQNRSRVHDETSVNKNHHNRRHHHSEEHINHHSKVFNNRSEHHQEQCCHPIMKKLKNMADRQKKRINIKKIPLKKDEKIILDEETKIIKLKNSPKAERGEIPHFIEKQDSDDVLEIVNLEESPSRKQHKEDYDTDAEATSSSAGGVPVPDEIIKISKDQGSVEADGSKQRHSLRKEHEYEDIENVGELVSEQINNIIALASVEALKQSLATQDGSVLKELEAANKEISLDRMGSSEDDPTASENVIAAAAAAKSSQLAPISSIESASSDDDRRQSTLSAVLEESDGALPSDKELGEVIRTISDNETNVELKPSLKKEPSPAPSDKKVTFSHVEDEAESHREDIELPDAVRETMTNRWRNMSDHEYEPIGEPTLATKPKAVTPKEPSPVLVASESSKTITHEESSDQIDNKSPSEDMKQAEEMQRELEERYFTPKIAPQTEIEIEMDQVEESPSALEESPMRSPENRKRSLIESAQDGTRKMQAGLKTQAAKLRTKLRTQKKPPSGSPKAKDRKRFKAPEFSKLRMPDIKRPDMSKLKDFKRPEFTKFHKPDMSKFKFPEKLTSLKLTRSKSFKESESMPEETEADTVTTSGEAQTQKKKFEFNFGTYPRAFRRKKKPIEPTAIFHTATTETEGPSIIPSTETQPSIESSSSPQGDRGPGPVRSRWADKFSDVSYNDSEGSRYRQYGSEQESFDRESSLERRMKDDLEQREITEADLGILGGVSDNKQFAEFDEENRAIHEISKTRAGEFKRRPMVHQDSDLVSEESKDPVGWTEKEIQKNKLLRHAELEMDIGYHKYPSEEGLTGSANINQETMSTTSSGGRKPVLEEIDNDTLFLRKRGVSQDDIDLRQYIKAAIREGLDVPENALKLVGQDSESRETSTGGYEVPPPKPRRLTQLRNYESDIMRDFGETRYDTEDDNISVSQTGSDYYKAPSRPLRKGRSRSKYSIDSQDVAVADLQRQHHYFDDDEYLRPPTIDGSLVADSYETELENLDLDDKENMFAQSATEEHPPQVPRRRKRSQRDSMEKDSYTNGFSGRSVSNSFLPPHEDVIIYRTEHEYHVPLATPETYTEGGSTASRKSRSVSRFEDDRISHGITDFEPSQRFNRDDVSEKYVVDMMENDGYAIVRKEPIPKPTPPARRKKFSRSSGERFATMPHLRKRGSPAPERPPPPRSYSTIERPTPPRRKSATSMGNAQNLEEYEDYEEQREEGPEFGERPESPRDLQSGEIINKMKYRPLPPPPRPPRDRRFRGGHKSKDDQEDDEDFDDRDGGGERAFVTSSASSYDPDGDLTSEGANQSKFDEVEVSTQTDPLPDDFVCEEFEITEDMKVIIPRRMKTLDDILSEERHAEEGVQQDDEKEMLHRGLQRFRDANQRSLSEKSRASSQADRSKSHSRPQTPSAIVIERRVSTPVPNSTSEHMWQASLIVRPLDGLETPESVSPFQDSEKKSDIESRYEEEEQRLTDVESLVPSSVELERAIHDLKLRVDSDAEMKEEVSTERDYEDYNKLHTHYQDYQDKSDISQQSEISRDPSPGLYIYNRDDVQETPQPPPRIRSEATALGPEQDAIDSVAIPPETSVAVSSDLSAASQPFPTRMAVADLEVERLRVHALQAGQIMVSQLHGVSINADELGCKSGNLVVKNIEFPEGFIEEIVERVRSSERPPQLHAAETQTSLQASLSEGIESLVPPDQPVKSSLPPQTRQPDSESPPTRPPPPQQQATFSPEYLSRLPSTTLDRHFQSPEVPSHPIHQLPFGAFSDEYLQSLSPIAFYNLRNHDHDHDHDHDHNDEPIPPVAVHRRRRHHRRRSSSSEEEYQRRRRSRSVVTQEPQGVAQASRQLLTACNLSLVTAINQLTNSLRPAPVAASTDDETSVKHSTQTRYVSALVALVILTTCGMLMFLLSGKNVHHHHWDYFNPPGNDGRSS